MPSRNVHAYMHIQIQMHNNTCVDICSCAPTANLTMCQQADAGVNVEGWGWCWEGQVGMGWMVRVRWTWQMCEERRGKGMQGGFGGIGLEGFPGRASQEDTRTLDYLPRTKPYPKHRRDGEIRLEGSI